MGKCIIRSMDIVEEKEDDFELKLLDSTFTPLPNVDPITLINKDNWLMRLTKEITTTIEPIEEEWERQFAQDLMDFYIEEIRPQTQSVVDSHGISDLNAHLTTLRKENVELVQLVKAQSKQLDRIDKRLAAIEKQLAAARHPSTSQLPPTVGTFGATYLVLPYTYPSTSPLP